MQKEHEYESLKCKSSGLRI